MSSSNTSTKSYGSTDHSPTKTTGTASHPTSLYESEMHHMQPRATSSPTALLPISAWETPVAPSGNAVTKARFYVSRVVHNTVFQWCIVALIALNAVVLGLETIPEYHNENVHLLFIVNWICMVIFVAEVFAKLFAEGIDFFKSGWNYFDVVVLSLSIAPSTGPWSALYALRCLRILRIISTAKPIKIVAESFVMSLYTASPVFGLLFLTLYIAALLSVSFFGTAFPEWYGTLPRALFTMFQVCRPMPLTHSLTRSLARSTLGSVARTTENMGLLTLC
jgi:hypothetical protein